MDEGDARAALERSLERTAAGGARLFGLLLVLIAAATTLNLLRLASQLGLARVLREGGASGWLWGIAQCGIAGVVVALGARPAARAVYGPLVARGVLVRAEAVDGPTSALGRLGRGFGALRGLEPLLDMFVPTRMATFRYDFAGQTHAQVAAGLYRDEELAVRDDGGAWVLVDPQAPGKLRWLVRRPRPPSTG